MTNNTSAGRQLVVSFHDLAPVSRGECEAFIRDMRTAGVPRITLLLTPKWHNGPLFTEDAEFAAWARSLRDGGHEISLHGWTHWADRVGGGPFSQFTGRIYVAHEGEFHRIGYGEARERIAMGLEAFEAAGLEASGFVAPGWLLSPEGRRAAADAGFEYTSYWGAIDIFSHPRPHPAPAVVFSSRNAWRRLASLAWARVWSAWNRNAPVLRLAAHPNDLNHPAIRDTIKRIASAALETRIPMTYGEWTGRTPPPDRTDS